LKAAGHVNEHGREFNPNSIKSMVEGRKASVGTTAAVRKELVAAGSL